MRREPTSGGFTRPSLPDGFDRSRARERREDPGGWRLGPAVADGLAQAIASRRDIRRFRGDPVPRAALRRLLEAAHQAPSVGYMQPWRFIVIESDETKAKVRALCERERLRQAHRFDERARHFLELKVEGVAEAPIGLCVCCDHGDADTEVLGRATIPDTDLYSTACAIQNLWLTARCEGLGVGWVSFYQPADLRTVLDIPDRVEPVAYLCIGYPDERPTRPGLETSGWARRQALAPLVFQERFGSQTDWFETETRVPEEPPDRQAASADAVSRSNEPKLPPGIEHLAASVAPADHAAALSARDHADELVKPSASLGLLETVVERFSAATGAPPPARLREAVIVACADHGVARHRVSVFDQHVSAQVAGAAARGETAVGVLSAARESQLWVADFGLAHPSTGPVADHAVARGTADITRGPAMSSDQACQALLAGADLARDASTSADCLVLGEIGIANTTVAAALCAGLCGTTPRQVCGRGTGADSAGLERKEQVVSAALRANTDGTSDPFELLRRLGGLELAALAGATLAAAANRRMAILDGLAAGVAALVAVRLCPAARDYLIASHRSAEPAHALVLDELGLEPILDLRLRLGEASGAMLCLPLIESAGRLHRDMATFDSAGVAKQGCA